MRWIFLDITSWKFILRKIKHVNYEGLQSVLISNIDQVCLGHKNWVDHDQFDIKGIIAFLRNL